MKVPDDIIQQIRESTDIVEVVGEHVSLKKRGKSYFGLCPFHQEKSPSFHVDPVRQFFHCFGCGAGGNVFSFLMQTEGMSFPESMRILAERAGIPLPESDQMEEAHKETEALYRINQMAADFYRDCLYKTEAGKKVLGYLEGRAFDSATIDLFQVGYAPNLWDGLIQKATREGSKLDLLEKAGLIVPKKDGRGHYDRFRGRLMFPIINPSGRIAGFGGRILTDDKNSPKYINSPETIVYQKSRILYGLHQSKTGIRREDLVILVEGYTDLMRLFQTGLDNAIATSGTALAEQHAVLLSRYTKNIILVFDGDDAGFQATRRAIQILFAQGFKIRILVLPEGQDPDTWLQKHPTITGDEITAQSLDVVDFVMSRESAKENTVEDRSRSAHEILDLLGTIQDPVERNLLVKKTGEILDLDERVLYEQMKRSFTSGESVQLLIQTDRKNVLDQAEETLVKLMIEDAGKWGKIIPGYIEAKHIQRPQTRRIFETIIQKPAKKGGWTMEVILSHFNESPQIQRKLTELLENPFEKELNLNKLAWDCILRLREVEVQQQINEIRQKLKTVQQQGKETDVQRIEYEALKKILKNMRLELAAKWKKDIEIHE
ncbi:DNA primase [candidate division KSB1 bacterium]|nr:DNA primase [candidate division KSB1 bacterium]